MSRKKQPTLEEMTIELRHPGQLDLRATQPAEFYVLRGQHACLQVLRVQRATYSASGLTVKGVSYWHFSTSLSLSEPTRQRADGSTYDISYTRLGLPEGRETPPRENTYLLRDLVMGRTTRGGRSAEISEVYATWEAVRERITPLVSRNARVLNDAHLLLLDLNDSDLALQEVQSEIDLAQIARL
jgi:hypothetical protein